MELLSGRNVKVRSCCNHTAFLDHRVKVNNFPLIDLDLVDVMLVREVYEDADELYYGWVVHHQTMFEDCLQDFQEFIEFVGVDCNQFLNCSIVDRGLWSQRLEILSQEYYFLQPIDSKFTEQHPELSRPLLHNLRNDSHTELFNLFIGCRFVPFTIAR